MNFLNNLKLNPVKFWRFAGIGGFSALIDISAFWFFLEIVGTSLFMATSLSYFITFFINYFGHALFTFKVSPTIANLIKFCVIVILNYLLSLLVVLGGMFVFEEPLFWKLTALILVAISGFILSEIWTFQNR